MGVDVGVSVGRGVNVIVNVGMDVNVSGAGGRVDVSVGEMFIDVPAGSGEDEAGACPVFIKLHARVVRIKTSGRISVCAFMC